MSPGKPIEWRPRPLSTRDSLLAAGAELFAECGLEGARVEAIAARAGVNKALISYHFGGKRQLYDAVLSALLEPLATRLAAVEARQTSAGTRLEEAVAVFGRMASGRPALAALLLREALPERSRPAGPASPPVEEFFAVFRRLLDEGLGDGSLRPLDPAPAALALTGGLLLFHASRRFQAEVFSTRCPEEKPVRREQFARALRLIYQR
jgi:AcrR family transcriptional regulator